MLQWESGASEAWRVAAEAAARREAKRLASSSMHALVRQHLLGFAPADVGPFLVDLLHDRRVISVDLLAACTTPRLRHRWLGREGYRAVTLAYWPLTSLVRSPEDLRAFIQLRFAEKAPCRGPAPGEEEATVKKVPRWAAHGCEAAWRGRRTRWRASWRSRRPSSSASGTRRRRSG